MIARPASQSRSGWNSLIRAIAWLMVIFYVAASAANVWLENRLHLADRHPAQDVLLLVGFGTFAVVGALLVAKRPGNPVGWIMAAVALMVGLFPAGDTYAAYVMTTRGRPDALAIIGAWFQSWYWYLLIALVFVYLPLLFPDGRLLSRRWLPAAVLAGFGTASIVILGALTETLSGQNVHYKIENPIGIEGLGPPESLPYFGVFVILLSTSALLAFASVAVRFRRSRGIERQQMKWFVYAAALIPVSAISDYLPWGLGDALFGVAIIGLPTAIGIAILRYRLYEIDILINRTLVYGALTLMLGLCYFGLVISLQYVFRALTGETSQIAIVASTLTITVLFNPLRRRIQRFMDKCFYRRKYDAAKTLEEFSVHLRDETDLDSLVAEMITVVRDTMQPGNVSLWLREPNPGEDPEAET